MARCRLSLFALLVTAAAVSLAAAACESVASPSASVPFSQTDLRAGTGAEAAAGSVLTVHYTGWLYDASRPDHKGVQFETSMGSDPFTFTLGAGSVIKGWEQGLVGLRVGGLRQLVIPPALAYGTSRTGKIPPNAALIFEVDLVAIAQ